MSKISKMATTLLQQIWRYKSRIPISWYKAFVPHNIMFVSIVSYQNAYVNNTNGVTL